MYYVLLNLITFHVDGIIRAPTPILYGSSEHPICDIYFDIVIVMPYDTYYGYGAAGKRDVKSTRTFRNKIHYILHVLVY